MKAYFTALRLLLLPTRGSLILWGIVGLLWFASLLSALVDTHSSAYLMFTVFALVISLFLLILYPFLNAQLLHNYSWRLLPGFLQASRAALFSVAVINTLLWAWLAVLFDENVIQFMSLGLLLFTVLSGSAVLFNSLMPLAVAFGFFSIGSSLVSSLTLPTQNLFTPLPLLAINGALLLLLWRYWPGIGWLGKKELTNSKVTQSSKLNDLFDDLPSKHGSLGVELIYEGRFALSKRVLTYIFFAIGLPLFLIAVDASEWTSYKQLILSITLLLLLGVVMELTRKLPMKISSSWLYLPLDRPSLFELLERLAFRELSLAWIFILPACFLLLPLSSALLLAALLPFILYAWVLLTWFTLAWQKFQFVFSMLLPVATLALMAYLHWYSPWFVLPPVLGIALVSAWLRPKVVKQFTYLDWASLKPLKININGAR